MKKFCYYSLCGLLLFSLIFYSCSDKAKDELQSLGKGKSSLNVNTLSSDLDTIRIQEADSIFNLAKLRGLTTVLADRYPVIRPHYKLAILYPLYNSQVALYVPLGFDPATGRSLKMVVLKERGYKRVIFTEMEPTFAWRQTNTNYNNLTGTVKFYRLNGTAVKAYQLVDGAAVSIIPVGGGGTSSINNSASSSIEISKNNSTANSQSGIDDDYDDDDGDGIPNIRDKCPATPALVWVDSNGCQIVFSIDEVEVKASPDVPYDQSGTWGFPPMFAGYEPGQPPPPLHDLQFPGDVGGGALWFVLRPGTNGNKSGVLCGSYNMWPTGNAHTAQVTNLGGNYVNLNFPSIVFKVRFNPACIEIANTTAVKASNILVDAFNYATELALIDLNAGHIPQTTGALKETIKSYMELELSVVAPGSTFTDGACIGGIPQSVAKYNNPVTGQCEELPL